MNLNKLALLREELQNLKKAADFLGFSLERSRDFVNRANWSPEELERLESDNFVQEYSDRR